MKQSFVMSLCMLFLAIHSFSQEATIKGQITDEDNIPLIQAEVVIDASKGWAAVSDFDGNYSIQVPAGEHEVLYRYLGKKQKTILISVQSGETIVRNIALEPESTELDIIVITGPKYEKKFGQEIVSMEVIPTSIIENNIAQATEALNRVPGYTQIGESPSIRGGSGYVGGASSRILFLVDGLPNLSAENGAVYFEALPLENLQQVEVLKGASSTAYGSGALNGVINFRTAWPRDDEPFRRLTVSNGFYQRHDANLIKSKNTNPKRNQNVDWWRKEYNHLPVFMNYTYEHRQKFNKIDLVLGAHYRRDQGFRKDNETNRFRINGKIRHISEKIEGLVTGVNWNFMHQQGGQFFLWSGVDSLAMIPSASPPGELIPLIDYHVDVIARRFTIDPYIDLYDQKDNRHSLKFRYYNNWSTNFKTESLFTNNVYGEYSFLKQNSERNVNTVMGISGFYTNTNGDTFGGETYNAGNAATFVQVDKKFFNKLNLTAGIRIEYNKVHTISPQVRLPFLSLFKKNGDITSAITPAARFGFNYEITKGTFLRGSFGQGFRVPTVNDYFIETTRSVKIVPNPDVLPENGWSAEIGIKQGVKVGNWQGFFDAAGFIIQYQDMIEFVPVDPIRIGGVVFSDRFQAQNVDNARISGFEFSTLGQGELFQIPFNFLVGYTLTIPINMDSVKTDLSNENHKYLNFRNLHSIKADMEATWRGVTLGFTTLYTSYMINIPPTQSNIFGVSEYRSRNDDGDLVVDGRIKLKISDHASLTATVKNMFNVDYAQRPGILEAPRNYTLQYQHNF